MLSTHRCRRCGHVLGSFVEFAPGLLLHQTRSSVDSQVQAARQLHEDQCPGWQNPPELPRPATTKPKPARTRKLAFPLMWRRREAG
jgi:hypothetical protein